MVFDRKDGQLGFEPMDEFMKDILELIDTYGSQAVRVFPPSSGVMHAFCDRLAQEVVITLFLLYSSLVSD